MKKLGLGLGVMLAGVLAVQEADAFCGFYVSGADTKLFNNATHVVLMREGTRTVLSMQNNYQGPPASFAMVVPVPVVLQKENVKTLESAVFDHIDQLSAPRLVEYWEQDPCNRMRHDEGGLGRGRSLQGGMKKSEAPERAKDLGVTIEAKFAVGEYEIVILSAKDAGGLDKWLRQENYKIPDGAQAYLDPYVQAGSKFFVAKVDTQKVRFDNGMAKLSPLRFHYDTETFSLPVRLGLMNSAGKQDLIVNILAQGQRYEVANYPNTSIPTNLDVAEGAKTQFGAFYAALFDRTLEKIPKAIVTEYAWDARSCDPCPSPAMTTSELGVLGADVLPSAQQQDEGDGAPSRRRRPSLSSFVLTRLHARYAKDSLGEDLVFRAAAPITGGREFRDSKGLLEKGALNQGSINNFQGRYAVRHPWTGPITCKDPQRGVWGGPPGGGKPPLKPAQDIAFAPRGSLQLATIIKGGALPDVIALPGAITPLGSPVVPVPPSVEPVFGSIVDAGAAPPAPADAGAPVAAPPPVPPKQGGCGCDVAGTNGAYGGMFAGVALALAGLLRRRRVG